MLCLFLCCIVSPYNIKYFVYVLFVMLSLYILGCIYDFLVLEELFLCGKYVFMPAFVDGETFCTKFRPHLFYEKLLHLQTFCYFELSDTG